MMWGATDFLSDGSSEDRCYFWLAVCIDNSAIMNQHIYVYLHICYKYASQLCVF